MKKGKLYICLKLVCMGPVVDDRDPELLPTWEQVENSIDKYFDDKFRESFLDSHGNSPKVSWMPINWIGFKDNPVKRDFGWFTVYDKLFTRESLIKKHEDNINWIYNHPHKSQIGNQWGPDWLENVTYIDIINHMIMKRNYFPEVITMPTSNEHTSHFIENFFPFVLNNRSSSMMNWDTIEADGSKLKDVIKWSEAPNDWSFYSPDEENHQTPGNMKNIIFRVLDIKTRAMTFPIEEIEKAFERCNQGFDTVITGYEHDFRDRSDVVIDKYLLPIKKVWQEKYNDIEVIHSDIMTAARKVTNKNKPFNLKFELCIKRDYLLITSNTKLFNLPYIVIEDNNQLKQITPLKIGINSWALMFNTLPHLNFNMGIAAYDENANKTIQHFEINIKENDIKEIIK